MKNKTLMKTLSAILAVVMVLCSAPLSGFVGMKIPELKLPEWNLFDFSLKSEAITSGIYYYTISNEQATIYDCNAAASGSVVIPSTLDGYPVTTIDEYAFAFVTEIKSVTIPDSVTSIGENAFYKCTGLLEVTIGDGVTSIGKSAFEYCTFLKTVNIGDSVTSIDMYAFKDCVQMKNITLPNAITSIVSGAFYYCQRLKDVYYFGSKEDWDNINIGSSNESLTNATIHYLGAHVCEFKPEVTKEPTCTESGVMTYKCSCDNFYAEEIPVVEHNFGEWKISFSASNSNDIVMIRSCSVCGEADAKREANTGIIIVLKDSQGNIVDGSLTDANATQCLFTDIEDGEYEVEILQANHVTRTYQMTATDGQISGDFKLHYIGDINGDNKVTVLDYTQLLRHVKKTSSLDGYAFDCADVNGDGKLSLLDYTKLLRHVKKTEVLW